MRFEVNFGQQSWGEPLPSQYKFINNYDIADRVRASKPPETKTDCTVSWVLCVPGERQCRCSAVRKSPHDEKHTREVCPVSICEMS